MLPPESLPVDPEPVPSVDLTVVIPVYNERDTVATVVQRVMAVNMAVEVILVDDGSSDGSAAVCQQLTDRFPACRCLTHSRNRGKGAAVRTGFEVARGRWVVVQDADLEYDPSDFRSLLEPLLADAADVVYGSRYATLQQRRADGWHYWVNGLITRLSNLRTGWQLTDVETCYKVCRRSVLEPLLPQLQETGFGFEIELTARLARAGARMVERPIGYQARGYAEGKKIRWHDGVRAIWCVLRY